MTTDTASVAAPAEALLVCPACRGRLTSEPAALRCLGCGRVFPVRDGVPRLLIGLAAGERQVQRSFDFEHARYEDSQRVHFRLALADELCQDVRLPREWFAGRRCLDAGCGSGRWSYALAAMGAEVLAVDLTESGVTATRRALAPFPGARVYQASLFDLPFPPESFDFVMSWGVLHHTVSTRAAFERLVPLVKPGGTLYVMLYERTGLRHRLLTDMVRALFRCLPDALRYRACRLLVIRDPAVYRLISPWLKVCDGSGARSAADLSTLVFDTFDAYSPQYNHVHTQTEVRRWFHDAGFGDVVLSRPIRFTTPDAISRWGECGGAVHVRGVRLPPGDSPAPFVEAPVEAPALTLPLGAVPAASAPVGLVVPPFDRPLADQWTGVTVHVPAAWTVRRDGAMTLVEPPLAIPPFQLGLYMRPAADAPLDVQAADSVRRWLPADQRAELLDSAHRQIDGVSALEQTFRLSLGRCKARAHFLFLAHHGMLCRLSGVSAWDADSRSLDALERAVASFAAGVSLQLPRRDPAARAFRLRELTTALIRRSISKVVRA